MKTYQGSCHCGAVKYEFTSDLSKAIDCNCSMCGRRGSVLTFVPASQFKLLSGEGNLQEYKFNKQVIQHLFCKTCGIASFSRGKMRDGSAIAAVNLRCVPEVDLGTLQIQHVDGKSY
jgi:hypothetical protein